MVAEKFNLPTKKLKRLKPLRIFLCLQKAILYFAWEKRQRIQYATQNRDLY